MKFRTNKARWTADADGYWLMLKCENAPAICDNFQDSDVEIKKHSEKRTLNANAYYWTLLGKLAKKIEVSNAAMHNMLLRRYGQIMTIDEQIVFVMLPDTEQAEIDCMEAETYHLKPTSQTRGECRAYMMIRGSSTYNKDEMKRLIDGLIEECKEVGIETMSEEELQSLYGQERV